MNHDDKGLGRRSFLTGLAGAAVTTVVSVARPGTANAAPSAYADPENRVLPDPGMRLDLQRAALVVIDPQVDFMSPKGASWSIVGESVTEQGIVPNLVRLFEAAKRAGIPVVISPHYYYPHDHTWKFGGPLEILQHK